MTRLSRHTVVVLLVALVSCIGGMSVAVVAFGQAGGEPDATVPQGDFTSTTPAQPAATTAPAGTTAPAATTPASTAPAATTPAATTPAKGQSNPGSAKGGASPSSRSKHPPPAAGSGPSLARVTRQGPTHLAFTGGEPLIVGAGGAALMLAGLALHLRRRRAGQLPAA
jgi:hypothetical protein